VIVRKAMRVGWKDWLNEECTNLPRNLNLQELHAAMILNEIIIMNLREQIALRAMEMNDLFNEDQNRL